MARFVLIGNPGNRRVGFFQQALARFELPPAVVLPWINLLTGRRSLTDAVRPGDIVRIDSPGEEFPVERALLMAGAVAAEAEGSPFLPPDELRALESDRGRILHPRQWYLGLERVLRQWDDELAAVGGVVRMSSPREIALMFDKVRCHAHCRAGRLPVPDALGPVAGYDELLARMEQAGCGRAFVKPAHGSSASGVVAFVRGRGRQEAITSAELVRTGRQVRLYNSLRVRRYTSPDEIRPLIDALAADRIHVERWLPKASLAPGTTFDLRTVVIGGQPRQLVVRQSRSPMTNLHLGNSRGDLPRLLEQLGPDGTDHLSALCRRVATLFPESLHIAPDILLTPGLRRMAVLEVNAFGDLLPGVLWNGLDTYATTLAALAGRTDLFPHTASPPS